MGKLHCTVQRWSFPKGHALPVVGHNMWILSNPWILQNVVVRVYVFILTISGEELRVRAVLKLDGLSASVTLQDSMQDGVVGNLTLLILGRRYCCQLANGRRKDELNSCEKTSQRRFVDAGWKPLNEAQHPAIITTTAINRARIATKRLTEVNTNIYYKSRANKKHIHANNPPSKKNTKNLPATPQKPESEPPPSLRELLAQVQDVLESHSVHVWRLERGSSPRSKQSFSGIWPPVERSWI